MQLWLCSIPKEAPSSSLALRDDLRLPNGDGVDTRPTSFFFFLGNRSRS